MNTNLDSQKNFDLKGLVEGEENIIKLSKYNCIPQNELLLGERISSTQ